MLLVGSISYRTMREDPNELILVSMKKNKKGHYVRHYQNSDIFFFLERKKMSYVYKMTKSVSECIYAYLQKS